MIVAIVVMVVIILLKIVVIGIRIPITVNIRELGALGLGLRFVMVYAPYCLLEGIRQQSLLGSTRSAPIGGHA